MMKGEVKPLIVSTGVGVVLENEVVCWKGLRDKVEIDCEEVTILEIGTEGWLRFLLGLGLVCLVGDRKWFNIVGG